VNDMTQPQLPFSLSPHYREILDQADRFAKKELHPLLPKMDDEEWWPPHLFPFLGESGYLGVTVPEELGGAGLDPFAQGLVGQAFARWNANAVLSVLAHDNLCVNNLLRNASPAQQRKYLPGLCKGTLVGALGLTEPGAGSDALGSMRTTARREGDHYILNGNKLYITNGPIADVILVYAKTSPEKGPHGISAFIVERNFPGFRVAQKLIKMGLRGSPTGELVFDNCRVPAENLVGIEDAGVAITMSGLDLERIMGAFCCLGVAERCLELAIDYAKTRKQFGKAIGEFQLVQGMLADMYTSIEALRSLTYQVAAEVNELERGGGGRGEAHKRTAAAILLGGQTAMQCADKAVQIHGGSGFIWDTEINRIYRGAKLFEIGAGTNEVRRVIIARELLGL
jgi:isovaleryl-CoA dehydrogenase